MGRKTFTAAVIGLGNIGLGYDLAHNKDYVQTHSKAYLKHQGFDLAFGVDPDLKKRSAFKRFSGCPSYASLKGAFKDFSSVDVLSVCVSPEHRSSLWDVIAQMRPRVVVLEKPLTKKLADGELIVSWARKHGIALAVNYIRRFEPSSYVIKAALEKNRLGRIAGIDIRYNGGFYNNASHYIEMMLMFFGKPRKARPVRIKKDGQDFDVDFILEYPTFEVQGRSVGINCPVGEITIWCENGKFFYQKFGQQIDIIETKPDPVFRKFNELALINTIETKIAYAMTNVADNIHDFCLGKVKLLSNGNSALETLRLCENILLNR